MLAMYDLYDAGKDLAAPIAAPLDDGADPAAFIQLCAESGILAVIEGEAAAPALQCSNRRLSPLSAATR